MSASTLACLLAARTASVLRASGRGLRLPPLVSPLASSFPVSTPASQSCCIFVAPASSQLFSRCFSSSPSSADSPPPLNTASEAAGVERPQLLHRACQNEAALLKRVESLQMELLGANWADYLTGVMDCPFWEEELRAIEEEAQPFANSPSVQASMTSLRRLFDLFYQLSDVRDHLNQIMELGSRAAGIAGTGLNASEEVSNVDEHAKRASAGYDRLMKEYPEYCAKVDDVLGSGLALLRQKHRFTFSGLHRFFY